MTENGPPAAKARLHVTIRGSVQGVGFRYFVVENGRALGLAGWARNRSDGSVEVVAEGPRLALERLLPLLQQGPRRSVIDIFEYKWHEPTGEFRGFSIRRF